MIIISKNFRRIILSSITLLFISIDSYAQTSRHTFTTIAESLSSIEVIDVFSMVEKRTFPFRNKMVPEIYGIIELDGIHLLQDKEKFFLVIDVWLCPNAGGWFLRPKAYLSFNGGKQLELDTSAIPSVIDVAVMSEIKVDLNDWIASGNTVDFHNVIVDVNIWLTDTDLGHRKFTIVNGTN